MLSVNRASAGSGKTFTLAKDYIKILISVKNKKDDDRQSTYTLNLDRKALPGCRRMLVPNRHRSILAVTFTNKATEEMKTRILKELRILADPNKKSDYQDDFAKQLHCTRQEMAIAADLALRQILYDYHNFNVSTIDSFFQRVLHTFARELDHQSDYNVDMSETAAMAQAVGTMLDDFNSSHYSYSKELERWITEYLSEQVDNGAKTNFFNRNSSAHSQLVKLMSKIGLESFKAFAAPMRNYLADPNNVNKFTEALRNKITGMPAELQKAIAPLISAEEISHLSKTTKVPLAAATALEGRRLDKNLIKSLYSDTAGNIINGTNVFTKKYGTQAQKDNMAKAVGLIRSSYSQIANLRKLLDSMPMLGLLAHAWHYLDELTKENNTLLISDTNELVHRIIGNDATPFIYERMGVKLCHFLLDEFQDTSRLQWENLQPLVENGLSTSDDSLIIGDEKQSIYRFRNSDSSILHSQVEDSLGRYIDPEAEGKRENINWRSSKRVVHFNNTLFSLINEQLHIDGYDGVVQKVSPKQRDRERGYVRFIETLSGNKKVNTPRLKSGSDEQLHMMAAEILRQHNSGYKWKDIAVLVYGNKEAQKVVRFLIDNYFGQINVLSDEALKIASSPAVQMVISTMKAIDAEADTPQAADGSRLSQSQIALALSRFEYCLNEQDAQAGAPDPQRYTLALRKALDPDMQSVGAGLLDKGADKPASILALAELIITRRFTAEERKSHFAYLAALQDEIINFSTQQGGSLREFLEWWDANSGSLNITGASEADAMRVMTVHKSKGLEFECVHIPFCTWDLHWSGMHPPQVWTPTPDLSAFALPADATPPPAMLITITGDDSSSDSIFNETYKSEWAKSLADTINKTYVAFTRAKSELIVWYSDKNSIIGNAINNAFNAGKPEDFDPENMVDLAPCLLPDDKLTGEMPPLRELVLGEPTVYKPDSKKDEIVTKGEPVEATYPASANPKARAVLSVASALGDPEANIAESDTDPDIDKEELADAPDEKSRIEGIILHEIMANTRRSSQLGEAARRVARMHGLDSDTASQLADIARKTFEIDPALARLWFDDYAKVRIEQPIYAPSPDIVRRPDRVVYLPDGSVHVIDYKFTNLPDRLGADSHIDQVREYAGLLRDSGHPRVSAYLIYPRLGKILPVTP